MSSPLRGTRDGDGRRSSVDQPRKKAEGQSRTAAPTKSATGVRWIHWTVAGLGTLLVLTVFLTSWLRNTTSSVSRGGDGIPSDDATALPAAKPTLSPTSTAEEIMAEMRRVADRLDKSFPNDPSALDVLARVEFGLGRRTEAMEIWRRCAELSAHDPAPYFAAMATVAANRGAADEAAVLFRKALESGSKDAQTPLLLADNLMKIGQFEEAISVLESHSKKGPVSNAALTTLGQAYLEVGQYEKAKTTFLAATQSDPKNKAAHYGLAMAYARLGDKIRAASSMDEFRKLDTQATIQHTDELRSFSDETATRQMALRGLIDAARCYLRNGSITDAEALLVNAAALVPNDIESRLELMTLYEKAGRNQLALQVCRQLQKIDPNKGDYWMNEGVLHARLDQLDRALAALERARQIAPDNQRYREVYELIQREKNP